MRGLLLADVVATSNLVAATRSRTAKTAAIAELLGRAVDEEIAPVTAAAATMAGLIRCVRAPAPWRPSKLRLDVDAQRSPGSRRSAFMARHMEQPGSRHSKPASRNSWSSPSASACCLTRPEPGTTSACLTLAATLRPRITAAAARRSSMREFVHEPMNTRSSRMSVTGCSADRPM